MLNPNAAVIYCNRLYLHSIRLEMHVSTTGNSIVHTLRLTVASDTGQFAPSQTKRHSHMGSTLRAVPEDGDPTCRQLVKIFAVIFGQVLLAICERLC